MAVFNPMNIFLASGGVYGRVALFDGCSRPCTETVLARLHRVNLGPQPVRSATANGLFVLSPPPSHKTAFGHTVAGTWLGRLRAFLATAEQHFSPWQKQSPARRTQCTSGQKENDSVLNGSAASGIAETLAIEYRMVSTINRCYSIRPNDSGRIASSDNRVCVTIQDITVFFLLPLLSSATEQTGCCRMALLSLWGLCFFSRFLCSFITFAILNLKQ